MNYCVLNQVGAIGAALGGIVLIYRLAFFQRNSWRMMGDVALGLRVLSWIGRIVNKCSSGFIQYCISDIWYPFLRQFTSVCFVLASLTNFWDAELCHCWQKCVFRTLGSKMKLHSLCAVVSKCTLSSHAMAVVVPANWVNVGFPWKLNHQTLSWWKPPWAFFFNRFCFSRCYKTATMSATCVVTLTLLLATGRKVTRFTRRPNLTQYMAE